MRTVTFEVGRLLWSSVRGFLEAEKFKGRKIEWIESSGIISRDFTLRGNDADVRYVCRAIYAAYKEEPAK